MKEEIQLTRDQENAVMYGGSLLLSAAAGSGKTKVLTEKVAGLIESGASLSEMLIVTFTKAAAAELKSKIAEALSKKMASAEDDTHLRNQYLNLSSAEIGTIHSFCLHTIRPYSNELGINPDFDVGDEAFTSRLRKQAMKDTVNNIFESDHSDRIRELADCISDTKENSIEEEFLDFARKMTENCISPSDTIDYADQMERSADMPFYETIYGKSIKNDLLTFCDRYGKAAEAFIPMLDQECELDRKVTDIAIEIRDKTQHFRIALATDDFNKIKEASLDLKWNFPQLRGNNISAKAEYFKDCMIPKYKTEVRSIIDQQKVPGFTEEKIAESMRETSKRIRDLAEIYSDFNERFSLAKKERGIVEYSDLENFAAGLIAKKDGTLSEKGRSIAQKYKYILVDEFQDTSGSQDRIFTALSQNQGTKIFYVGDVKQSIYGFRGADPGIFTRYRKTWEKHIEDESVSNEPTEEKAQIFMSDNFRCDKPIIDFVNMVSEYNFPFTDTPFEKEDMLKFSKRGETSAEPVEIDLVGIYDREETDDENENSDDSYSFLAKRVKQLIGSGVECRDIAILLRSLSGGSSNGSKSFIEGIKIAKALGKYGIPTDISEEGKFINSPEIMLVVSILNTVDNPSRDVYLAGTMKSPVFGFDIDEITEIKLFNRNTSMWNSMAEYMEEHKGEELSDKCGKFVSVINGYRQFSNNETVYRLLTHIYRESGISMLRESGNESKKIRDNLQRLLDIARNFEKFNNGGLYGFLVFLSQNPSDTKAAGKSGEDKVRVMTIHKSKGLEFPVVILFNAQKEQNERDSSKKMVFEKKYGIAMKLSDKEGRVRKKTTEYNVIGNEIKKNVSSEEARLLYVAMTRARNKLIVVASDKKGKIYDAYRKETRNKTILTVPKSNIRRIIDACSYNGDKDFYKVNEVNGVEPEISEEKTEEMNEKEILHKEVLKEDKEKLHENISYVYPFRHLVLLPSKLPVSSLYPQILDERVDIAAGNYDSYFEKKIEKEKNNGDVEPRFIQETEKGDPAEKGTAAHLFLEFCDLDNLKENGIDAELDRQLKNKFINDIICSRIDRNDIERFLESDLFGMMTSAKKLRREYRFTVPMNASDFSDNNELKKKFEDDKVKITVQGVIDCIITDDDGELTIIDYKTDRFYGKQMADREEVASILRERHGRQLHYYRNACEILFTEPVKKVLIYSVPLGECIDVENSLEII